MNRGDLLLAALALLCLAGLVLGVGGVALLKRDRSAQDGAVEPPSDEDTAEEA